MTHKITHFKIIFALLFVSIFNGYGQTYEITLQYAASGEGCHAAGYGWDFIGGGNLIGGVSDGGNDMDIPLQKVVYDTPAYGSFSLSIRSSCIPLGEAELECNDNYTYNATAVNLLKGASLSAGGCNGYVYMSKFIPNVSIKNLDTASPTEVCAGFQLSLAAFPLGFPNEAYHWQYSVNNKVTWTDVPATIGGFKKNDTPTTTFSMQELLGNNHADYIGKQIYFRLGYSSTAFTTPLALTYSACSPIVTDVTYVPPACNGDLIPGVTVTFNRPLEDTEYLVFIYLKNKNTGAVSNQRVNAVFDAGNPNTNTYTFSNIGSLENANVYQIGYQAQKGAIARGSMFSDKDFTYNDPPKMQFKITGFTQPTCSGASDGTISIEIVSGSGSYKFYVDDATANVTKIDNLHYQINGLSANPSAYKIKVTDQNNCLDSTANE